MALGRQAQLTPARPTHPASTRAQRAKPPRDDVMQAGITARNLGPVFAGISVVPPAPFYHQVVQAQPVPLQNQNVQPQ